MSGRRRALLVIVLGFAGVLCALVAEVPRARQVLIDRAIALLRDRYGIVLEVDRVDLQPASLAVRFEGLSLAPAAAPDRPFFRADRADFDLSVRTLRGRWSFDRIILAGPVAEWATTSLQPSARASRALVLPRLDVAVFEVHDLTFDGTAPSGVRVALRELQITGSGTASGADFDAAGALWVETPEGRARFDRSTARVSLRDDGSIVIHEARASSETCSLRINGTIGLSEPGPLDLRYEGALIFDERTPTPDGMPPLHGRIGVRGTIGGTRSSPAATWRLRAEHLDWGYVQGGEIDAAGQLARRRLTIEGSLRSASMGAVRSRGSLALNQSDSSWMTAEWHVPDAGRLPILPASAAKGLSVAARAEGSWAGPRPHLASLTLTGRAVVRAANPAAVANVRLAAERGRLTARFDASGSSDIAVSGEAATELASSAIWASPVTGHVRTHIGSIPAVARQLRSVGVDVSEIVEALDGSARGWGSVTGTLREPSLRATVEAFGSGAIQDRLFARAEIHANRSGVHVAPLTVQSTGGNLDVRGSIRFADRATAGSIEARFDRLDFLAAWLPTGGSTIGSLSASGWWTGTLRDPVATLEVQGAALERNGLRFDRLAARLALAGRALVLSDLTLAQPHGRLRAAGHIDLRSRAFSLDVEASHLDVSGGASDETPGDSPTPRPADLADLSLRARAHGALARGDSSLVANVDLAAFDCAVLGGRLRLANAVALGYDGQRVLLIGPARLVYGASTLTASGRWGEGSPEGLVATLDASANDLLPLLRLPGGPGGWSGEGSLRLRVTVAGSPRDPRVSGAGSIAFSSLRRGDREVARDLTARATLEGDVIELAEVSGRVLESTVQASGTIPLAWLLQTPPTDRPAGAPVGAAPATLAATWQVELDDVLRSLGKEAVGLGGTATLSLDARAAAPRLGAIEGTLTGVLEQLTARETLILARTPLVARIAGGRLQVEALAWQGPEIDVSLSGDLGFAGGVETNLQVRGQTALRLADQFLPARVTGRASFDVRLIGSPGHWRTDGTVRLADGALIAPQHRLALADWSGTIVLSPDGIRTQDLRGQVNAGAVEISGALGWGQGSASALGIRAREVFLEIGEGFRGQLDADVAIAHTRGAPQVSGLVSLTPDTYREGAAQIAATVAALTARRRPAPSELPRWLADSPLDVRLEVTGPLVVDNRMAQIELEPQLTLVGTVGQPALRGRVDVVQDGRIQAAGRSYRLNDGAIEFSGQSLIPTLNVSGQTRIGTYDVTLRLTGSADAIETSLSSDPPLGEGDLRSLLLTGQTTGVTGSTEGNSQFVGEAVSADVLGLAGQFIGLDSIRVGTDDFELVSGDVKAARRLTVSKRIGMRFELFFSQNLDDDELTWIIVYRPRPGYEVRVSSRESVEQSLELRREITFGPGAHGRTVAARRRSAHETIAEVAVTGEPGFAAAEVLGSVKLQADDRFDFTEWWRDRGRIEQFYRDRGYFAVRVVPTRTVVPGTPERIRLAYRIARGPRTELVIDGYRAPRVLAEQLQLAWAGAVFPEFLSERLTALTRRHLVEKGYLRARVDVEVTGDAAMQRARVRVTQGPLTTDRRLAFSGNTVITARELEALAARFLEIEAWIDPAALEEAIHAEYEARGYAAAVARPGQPAFGEGTATLPVTIEEGPQGRLRTLSLRGIPSPDEADARAVLGLPDGSPLTPDAVRQARLRLERHYRTGGFRDARVTASARVEASTGWTDVAMDVARGSLYTVRHVSIQGAQTTKESLVRSALTLAPGSVASPAAVGETERRLYGIGVFRAAAVRLEPISEAGADAAETPVDAIVTVEEARRYQLRFGIEANTEYQPAVADRTNGAGLALDLRDRNFLGRALSLGIGMRYERSLQSFRALFAVPRLGSLPVRTNVYGVWRREQDDTPSGLALRDDSTELIVEQRWQPRRAVELAWGYSLEWQDVRLVAPEERTPRGFDGVLASLYGTLTIDRRDSALDATRGWFQSASVQWGLRALGSTLDYLRLHLRSSYYQPVGPVVLASAVRAGAIVSWDGRPGPNVEDLFFKAGGTQSVRGYAQDTLSAVDFLGIPFGGTRVLVLNQEARFPLFWRLAGVVFADAGNTFLPQRADLGDLRLGAGFGLRIRTPLAPLRLDLAWPVSADDSQRGPRWHFSIGQMF